jgi:CheY-like chemotaxis protein
MAFRPSEGSVFPELVLFVGRDGVARRAYTDTLVAFGFRLDTASNLPDAFQQSLASAPDVIVSVDGEDGIDSLSLGRLLRRDPRTRDIPHIVIGLAHAARAALPDQIDSVLARECLPETLGAEIRRLLVIGRETRLKMLGVQLANAHAHRYYSGDWDQSGTERAAAIRDRVSSRFRTFLKAGTARCRQCGKTLDVSAPSGVCPECGLLLRQRG